jgi:putative flippase GtrA
MMSAAPPAKLPAEFLRFAVAGAVGFGLDAGLLLVFTSVFGWPALLARLASFAIALVATWMINRAWTFRAGRKNAAGIGAEFASYGAVQLTGGAVNYAVYAGVVFALGREPWQLMVALAAGSGAGMALNYLGAKRFVFRVKD